MCLDTRTLSNIMKYRSSTPLKYWYFDKHRPNQIYIKARVQQIVMRQISINKKTFQPKSLKSFKVLKPFSWLGWAAVYVTRTCSHWKEMMKTGPPSAHACSQEDTESVTRSRTNQRKGHCTHTIYVIQSINSQP